MYECPRTSGHSKMHYASLCRVFGAQSANHRDQCDPKSAEACGFVWCGTAVWYCHFLSFQKLCISYHLSKHTGELSQIMNWGTKSVTTILHQLVFLLAPTLLEALFVSAVFWKLGKPVVELSTVVAMVLCMDFTVVVAKHRVVVGRRLVDLDEDRAILII